MGDATRETTPIGLAILVAAVGWLSAQVMTGLQQSLLVSYDPRPATVGGGPGLDFRLTNESASRPLVSASVILMCPDGAKACLRPAFTDTLNKFADPVVLPPWNVNTQTVGDDGRSVTISNFSLPAGATLDVEVGLVDASTRPALAFDVPQIGPVPDLQLFERPFWGGWARNYVLVLGAVWVVLLGAVVAWVVVDRRKGNHQVGGN